MSKTGWIILGICLGLVVCICLGVFLAGWIARAVFSGTESTRVDSSATKDYKDLNNTFSANGVYSVQMKDLKTLNIDWISGSVTLVLTDGDTILIEEVSNKAIQERDALRFGVSGNTLRIQACKKGHIGDLPRKELTVSLPRSLADELKACEFDTVSAAVSAGELNLDELEVDTVSGRIQLSKMIVDKAQVDTVSGQIELVDCTFDSLRVDSVSAFVHMSGASQKARASSVSGEIQLHLRDCRELKVNTMSGRIVLDLATVPQEMTIDTTSGKTSLTLPPDASCTIKLDAMSGKLYLNDEAVNAKKLTLGDGSAVFDIDSMSGSVYVYTK